MDYKLLIACCVFSFITGMYLTVMLTKDKGCTVEFKHGQESHIVVGTRW